MNSLSIKKEAKSKVSLFSKKESSSRRFMELKEETQSKNRRLLSFFNHNSKLFMGNSHKNINRFIYKMTKNARFTNENVDVSNTLKREKENRDNEDENDLILKEEIKNEGPAEERVPSKKSNKASLKKISMFSNKASLRKISLKKYRSGVVQSRSRVKERSFKSPCVVHSVDRKSELKLIKRVATHQIIDQVISKNFRRKSKKRKNAPKNSRRLTRNAKLHSVKNSIRQYFDQESKQLKCRDIKFFPTVTPINIKNKIQYDSRKAAKGRRIFVLDKVKSRQSTVGDGSAKKISKKAILRPPTIDTHQKQSLKKFSLVRSLSRLRRRKNAFVSGNPRDRRRQLRKMSITLENWGRDFLEKKAPFASKEQVQEGRDQIIKNLKSFKTAFERKNMVFLYKHLVKMVSKQSSRRVTFLDKKFFSKFKSSPQGNFNEMFDFRVLEFSQRVKDFWNKKSKNLVREIFNYLKEELFLQSIRKSVIRICFWILRVLEDKCKVITSTATKSTNESRAEPASDSESLASIEEQLKKDFQVELFFDSDKVKEKEKKNLLLRSADFVGIYKELPDKFIFNNLQVRRQ